MVWFGQHAPHTSTFVPLYGAIKEMPKSYAVGSIYKASSLFKLRFVDERVLNASRFELRYAGSGRLLCAAPRTSFITTNSVADGFAFVCPQLDRDSSWWAYAAVSNYAEKMCVALRHSFNRSLHARSAGTM